MRFPTSVHRTYGTVNMTSKSSEHSLIEMVLKVVLNWLFHWDLGSLNGKFPTEKVCTFVLFSLIIIIFFFSVQFFSDSILLLVTKNQNIGTVGEPFFWFLR